MLPLRDPDPDLPGFQLPAHDAPRVEWERAFAKLNAIPMTIEQIMLGFGTSLTQAGDPPTGSNEILRLRAFYEAEGLLPADVAAAAILVRWESVLEADFHGGIDFFEGDPPYAATALRELRVDGEVLQFIGQAAT